jgi:L-proline amide hydrolase
MVPQLGCGHSTRLPEKKGDKKFWTPELFLAELDNLIQHLGIGEDYDVLGQSWGGILAALHAVGGPAGPPSGLKRVIIADSLTNMATWVVEARKLRNAAKDIPDDVKVCFLSLMSVLSPR